MKIKQHVAVLLTLTLSLTPGMSRAASQDGYRLTAPPAFPVFNTSSPSAWAVTNGGSVVWTAGGSAKTTNTISQYPDAMAGVPNTAQYRLIESAIGSSFEHIKPEYYLGDQVVAPTNVNWDATFAGLTNSASFFYEPSVPAIIFATGGLISFDWVLSDGSTVPSHYQVSGSSSSKPYRIYWTDEPYNAPPVDLTGKFVKFYGNPGILTLETGAVTNNAGGFISVSTNVVKGLFLDPATHWLKALGGIEGQVVMAYYRTGNYSDLLGTIAVQVCEPDIKTVPGSIGKQLLPSGDGYTAAGLEAMVTEGMESEDDVGAYVYQHKGSHSYSPKNGAIYAIRKSVGKAWKIEVYWRQQDLLGTSWPFEVLCYECDWSSDAEKYVRGQETGSDGTVNYGLTIPIPKSYTSKLMEFQEPAGQALLDANNVFSTKVSGYSLLKLTGTDVNGDDNVWFVSVQSIERDSPQFDLTPGNWPIGVEVAPLPTAIALELDGTSGYLEADMTHELSGAFTVEGWFQFKPPVVSSHGQTLFFKQSRSPIANHLMDFRVDLLPSGIIQSYFESDTLGQVGKISIPNSVGMGDGLWHHVAFVYEDQTMTSALYLDGVPTISTSFARTGVESRAGSLFVGRNEQYADDVSPDYFNGRVDDLRVWNRVLTTDEIQNEMIGFLHNATTATDLVAYYPIDNCLGRDVKDASGQGRVAAMVNCIRVAEGKVGLSDMASFSKYHGYIYEAVSGNYYNTNLYIRPDQMKSVDTASVDPGSVASGDPNALSADETYIFAINKTRAGDRPIEIWWSNKVFQNAMPDPVWFPAWVQQYQFNWPEEDHEVPKIVLASQRGSANQSIVKLGAAVDFSQSTESRMSLPDGNWFSGNNYTVECWIKPYSLSVLTGQVFDFNNGDSSNQVALLIQSDGSVTYTIAGDINHAETLSVVASPLRVGIWTHLALVVSDGFATVYQNGKTVYPQTELSVPAWAVVTTNNFLAYGSHGSTKVSFDGQIDEFRIWNVARSSSDVANTFLTSLTGTEPGLRLCYSFDRDVTNSTEARYAYNRVDQAQAYISYANWALPGAPRLDSGVLMTTNAPFVYVQNDETQPGYNPNEEHAFTKASEGGYVTYALRCDLNIEESSDPYVLVQYDDPGNFGRPNMQVYHVVPTNLVYSEFATNMTAGTLVPGPHPLDLLPDPWNEQTYWGSLSIKNDINLPAYRDRKLQIWAKCAGTNGTTAELEMHNFYPMQDGFFFPSLGEEQPEIGTPVPWLCRLFDKTQDVLTGSPIDWTWTVVWPSSSPSLDIGQTLTLASMGLPEVWGAKSMMLIDEPQADSVALYDPIVVQAAGLDFEGDFSEYFGFESGPNGNLQQKNGQTFFKGVPPNVSDRFYFDPAAPKTACLKLKGNRVAPAGGLSYLQLNVLSTEEREALMNLAHGHTNAWREAIETLAETRVNTALAHDNIPYDSIPVVNYALTHMGPGAGGYVTLIENDARNPLCHVNDGDPIQMHIIQLSTHLYVGSVLPLEDPNDLLSEQLDIVYTESFAGKGSDFEFQWKRSQPNADGTTPTDYVNQYSIYLSKAGLTRFTIGKQGDTLPDMVNNFYVMRYRAKSGSAVYAVTGETWSDWVGPTLAEGWVQRVLNSVTPFTQRMQDMYNNPAETDVSMIQQAGGPYEGDVALNQDNLDDIGLIQLYQTILNKAESMSLTLGINDTAANQQLLLAATRLNDLYMLLGNEAYADAMDPTIGFGSDFFNHDNLTMGAIDYGALHSSLFCFDNLEPTLRDEELALLRGRSDQLAPSLHLSPTYNRLYWNFTKGITAGEVAYAMNYQIYGTDVTIDQPQAAAFYPQGHGDAWGHYLSALNGYYRLMRNPWFSWGVPSISPMIVGDAVVNVDYYDEAKFAESAAAMARTGVEIVKRTCEKAYVEQGGIALAGYMDSNTNRAFGYGEWGSRAGLASLYNWAAANSLLPSVTNNTAELTDGSITRINRDSVGSLSELSAAMKEVQHSVDLADAGMTSIGLSGDAIPFDIDPAELMNGTSHFEQILARSEQALGNAETLLDRAQGVSKLQRQQAQSAANMAKDLTNEEAALNIQLIGIFGYPYSADVGAGGTYPQGYNGPDLYHYMWMDLAKYGFEDFELESKISKMFEIEFATIYGEATHETRTLTFEFASNGMVVKPDAIQGSRRAQGRIQAAYGSFINAYLNYRKAQIAYEEKVSFLKEQSIWAATQIAANTVLEGYATKKGISEVVELFKQNVDLHTYYSFVEVQWNAEKGNADLKESVPQMIIAGMAVGTDIGAPIKATLNGTFYAAESCALAASNLAKMKYAISQNKAKRNQEIYTIIKDLAKFTFESHETTAAIEELLMDANEAALDLDATFAVMVNAQESYTSVLGEGEALLSTRERLRKQGANRIASGRYQDMAFRTFRSDALAKYGNAFDLAKKYTYLAAKAYDYETALGLDDESNDSIFREIVGARTIGFVEDGEAQMGGLHGDGGLADVLARLKSNWLVLKGRLGINNAQVETCWLSLRSELFRLKPAGNSVADTAWQNTLSSCRVDNLLAYPEFRRYCLPFNSSTGLKDQEPGLVIPFSTTIEFARNVFGWPLAGDDHAFDSSHYATKIHKLGVKFIGYNKTTNSIVALADEPRIYLIPVGNDIMRSPGINGGDLLAYNVVDQVVPLPFPLGNSLLDEPDWIAIYDAYTGNDDPMATIRRYPSLRAYHDHGTTADDMISSTRLVGRSVWNTRWLLIIPAGTFHADRDFALQALISGADLNHDGKPDQPGIQDIQIGFETYSNSGN